MTTENTIIPNILKKAQYFAYGAIFYGAFTTICNIITKKMIQREKRNQKLAQFSKTKKFYKNYEKIKDSFIIVVGVGGVGSHVVSSLARAGVSKIRIIDFDLVSVSSLNRHAFSFREDVGTSKVASTKKYLKEINPSIEVEIIEEFLNKDNVADLLSGNPDFVADCIDDLDTKISLLSYCKKHNIRVVSSGGAGMKADPTKIQMRDISNCSYDSLTKRMREELRKEGIESGIPVLFSIEKCERELLPLMDFQEEDPDNYRQLPNMRLRIVPVLGTMPSTFGVIIADFILGKIGGERGALFVGKNDDAGRNFYVKMMEKLRNITKKIKVQGDFDLEDLYFSGREVWNLRDAVDGKKKNHLFLAIWDRTKPLTGYNLVLVNQTDANRLNKPGKVEELEKSKIEIFGEKGIKKVENVLKEAKERYDDECRDLYTMDYK